MRADSADGWLALCGSDGGSCRGSMKEAAQRGFPIPLCACQPVAGGGRGSMASVRRAIGDGPHDSCRGLTRPCAVPRRGLAPTPEPDCRDAGAEPSVRWCGTLTPPSWVHRVPHVQLHCRLCGVHRPSSHVAQAPAPAHIHIHIHLRLHLHLHFPLSAPAPAHLGTAFMASRLPLVPHCTRRLRLPPGAPTASHARGRQRMVDGRR